MDAVSTARETHEKGTLRLKPRGVVGTTVDYHVNLPQRDAEGKIQTVALMSEHEEEDLCLPMEK